MGLTSDIRIYEMESGLKMRTLYIHAGGVKTGSSAIQNLLELNADRLREQGIAYENRVTIHTPYDITSGNGGILYEALISESTPDSVIDSIVASYMGDCERAICSSEHFTHLSANGWARFERSANRLALNYRIIFFMRNVLPFLMSSYDQMVKRHGEWRDFDHWIEDAAWQHDDALKSMVAVVPVDRIHVVSYDAVKRRLFKAFLGEIEIGSDFAFDESDQTVAVNRSLSDSERKILRTLNRIVGGRYSAEISDLMIYADPEKAVSRPFVGDQAIHVLRERFAGQVAWVNETAHIVGGAISLGIEERGHDLQNQETRDGGLSSIVSNALLHWLVGKLPDFFENQLDRVSSVARGDHYHSAAEHEQIVPGDFDSLAYVLLNRDVFFAQIDPIAHYVNYGRTEGRAYKFERRFPHNPSALTDASLADRHSAVSLDALFESHQGRACDKWTSYVDIYENVFRRFSDSNVRLLEIGIQNGGSLEIWIKYFRHAEKIVGCDVNPACKQLHFADPRISVVVGDANSPAVQEKIFANSPYFDLIMDDGSHTSGDIVKSFDRFFPALTDGGLYIVEDLHCSYWAEYAGGLSHPYSSIAFFKELVDIVNHEHWGSDHGRASQLERFKVRYGVDLDETQLAHIHSIEFFNSICVIRKERPALNTLGRRRVTGREASVSADVLQLRWSEMIQPDQRSNVWAKKIPAVQEELAKSAEAVSLLTKQLATVEHELVRAKEAQELLGGEWASRLSEAQGANKESLARIADTERQHAEQLDEIFRIHSRETAERESAHKNQERYLSAQLASAREKLEQLLIDQAHRERVLSDQLHRIEEIHSQQFMKLAEERAVLLEKNDAALARRDAELVDLSRQRDVKERELQDVVTKLEAKLSSVVESRSWRWTSIFRSFVNRAGRKNKGAIQG